MNSLNIIGRLTRDPELTPAKGDRSQYVKFTVAVDHRYGDGASFFNCVAFGKIADIIDKFLSKGRQVGITGEHEQSHYEDKEGKKLHSWTVKVERVEFLGGKSDGKASGSKEQFAEMTPEEQEELPF